VCSGFPVRDSYTVGTYLLGKLCLGKSQRLLFQISKQTFINIPVGRASNDEKAKGRFYEWQTKKRCFRQFSCEFFNAGGRTSDGTRLELV